VALIRNLLGTNPSGGDAAPNIEDVFSTYLYDGTGATQSIENGINLGDFGVGTSTEFDGVNDYLQKSSDLTGNTDGKTFTFSAWVYPEHDGSWAIYANNGLKFMVYGSESQTLIIARNTSDTNVYYYDTANALPKQNWSHLIVSVDLTNTSRNHIYINEVDKSTYSTFTNDNIDFTNQDHYIGEKTSGGGYQFKGRIAHLFLDYTYRDLSTESNRRLFIDANGGSTPPATLSALNPIMYLPMTTAYSIGENIGSGGDFTSVGSPTIINKGTEYVADSGDGGMVWIKSRQYAQDNQMGDTERGFNKYLITNSTTSEGAYASGYGITGFNSDGFDLGLNHQTNYTSGAYTSWTFRKRERFFDVVTWTGNGVAGREIPHSLNCEVGIIILKSTSAAGEPWHIYHRDLGGTKHLRFDAGAVRTGEEPWNNTAPTDSVFTLAQYNSSNGSGKTYVAYLFAHDPDGEDNDGMIACGSYTGNAGVQSINIGWEPQYVLIKRTDQASGWAIYDSMRTMVVSDDSGGDEGHPLYAHTSNSEDTTFSIKPQATGFAPPNAGSSLLNENNGTYIYMAIRAPMMVEPEAGTEVFAIDTKGSTGDGKSPAFRSGFPVDMLINRISVSGSQSNHTGTRLTQGKYLVTNTTAAESADTDLAYDYMNGYDTRTSSDSNNMSWMWKRAKGFFDVVAYEGVGSADYVDHSLSVAPEMMWVKKRSATGAWAIYHSALGNTKAAEMSSSQPNTSSGWWSNISPDADRFSVGSKYEVNGTTGADYIAYLFATLAGVSKVGNYTGNGSSQNISCGFSAGARFVLIKRTDANGDWYLWDTERGIVTGNDPHLSLNSTSAEVTSDDSIDPQSAGFTVNQVSATNINVSSGTYIFLAIA